MAGRVPEGSIASATFDDFFAAEAEGQVRRAALLLGSVEEANDVTQEAFLRLYRRWSELDDPGSYLNRTVLNLCRDRFRRRSVFRRIRPKLTTPPDVSMVHDSEYLGDALGALPFNHRAALVLRYWAGLTTDEIAEQLQCPPGSVGPWINRGLATMRKALQ